MNSLRPRLTSPDQLPDLPVNLPQGLEISPQPRAIAAILHDLAQPLPSHCIALRRQGGQTIKYVPWYKANRLLDYHTGGHWEGRVTQIHTTADRIVITYAVTIHASDGTYTREAAGTELLKETLWDKESQTWITRELPYGDCSSNAESMAFRRACARFGLALNLYDKDK